MSKTLAPSVTTRDPKGLKFLSIVDVAYNGAGLSDKEAQRVNEATGLAKLVEDFIAANRLTDRFKDEEIEASYGYPKGYKRKDLTAQTNRLRELFSGIGFADEKLGEQPLPLNAEGYFAIPRWETMAPTYQQAVEKVLAKLEEEHGRTFVNYRKGELGPDRIRQEERTAKMLADLGRRQQGYDILVVPAQFGLRHRGRSVRRAREVMQDAGNEFGLGAFAVGIMLLTHPEREVMWEQLHVDCAGDEYAPGADGRFVVAPFFGFGDGELKFFTSWFNHAYRSDGSVSAFLPQ